MAKGRTRRVSRYSNEFKITAIRLASLPGDTYPGCREDPGHPSLHALPMEERVSGRKDHGEPHPDIEKLTEMEEKVSEQSRIRELERALKKAQIENDLLKKTIQFNLEQRRKSSPLLTGIIPRMDSGSSADTTAFPEADTTHGKKGR